VSISAARPHTRWLGPNRCARSPTPTWYVVDPHADINDSVFIGTNDLLNGEVSVAKDRELVNGVPFADTGACRSAGPDSSVLKMRNCFGVSVSASAAVALIIHRKNRKWHVLLVSGVRSPTGSRRSASVHSIPSRQRARISGVRSPTGSRRSASVHSIPSRQRARNRHLS